MICLATVNNCQYYLLYKLSIFMLFKKRQDLLYLQKKESFCGMSCCHSLVGESERRTESNLRLNRQKISIRKIKNRRIATTQGPAIIDNAKPKQIFVARTLKMPKFHFTYTNSNTTFQWMKDGGGLNKTTIVENLEVLAFQNKNESQHKSQAQLHEPKEAQKKVSIESDALEIVSTKANANYGQEYPSKQQNNQPFFSPQKTRFQRGQLFNVVRRSQTIMNDYKSDSQESQVIDDYKSLMSKIQEIGVEEEFQEI